MTHQFKQMQKEYQDELDELTTTISLRNTELCTHGVSQKKISTTSTKPASSKTSS